MRSDSPWKITAAEEMRCVIPVSYTHLMSEMVKVVVDAMGGDNAPEEPVKAAVEAVKEKENIQVILTGVQDVIEAELRKYPDYPKDRIRVVHASQDVYKRQIMLSYPVSWIITAVLFVIYYFRRFPGMQKKK